MAKDPDDDPYIDEIVTQANVISLTRSFTDRKKIGYVTSFVQNLTYFVDKTHYIGLLEQIENPVFLRPKRFGKSLWCSILEHYYDLKYADRFDELFGHTRIGQQPTESHNRFIVLSFDFSTVHIGRTVDAIEQSFNRQNNTVLEILRNNGGAK